MLKISILFYIAGAVMSTTGIVKAIKSRGYDLDAPMWSIGGAVSWWIGTFIAIASQISFYKIS